MFGWLGTLYVDWVGSVFGCLMCALVDWVVVGYGVGCLIDSSIDYLIDCMIGG